MKDNLCAHCIHALNVSYGGFFCEETGYTENKTVTERCDTFEPDEPERHGRWIQSDALDYKDPNGVIHVHGMCSCCRTIYDFRDMTSRFKFCPNCGARMDATDTNVLASDGGAENG